MLSGPGVTGRSTAVSGRSEALVALGEWMHGVGQRRRVRLWLSGGLCRPFVLAPIPGVADRAELVKIALASAGQRTGLDGALAVWVEHRAATAGRVVVAVQAELREQLVATVASAGWRVASIQPWWSEVLRRSVANASAAPVALAVQDCDALTFIHGQARDIHAASTYTPVLDAGSARGIVTRACVSVGLDDAAVRRVLLSNPAQPVDAPDQAQGAWTPSPWIEVVS